MNRPSWDEYFMNLAKYVSARSTCPRLHVGCVIVDSDHHIISTGYNGAPPGKDHCDDVGCLVKDDKCQRVIHAERNALSQVDWNNNYGTLSVYCNYVPCLDCASRITTYSWIIKEVVYNKDYKFYAEYMKDLFNIVGIELRQYKGEE